MALPSVFEDTRAHVQDMIADRVNSQFISALPMLHFLGATNAEAMGKFGQPETGMIFGNPDLGQANFEQQYGSIQHRIKFQRRERNDTTGVELNGSTPVASGFSDLDFIEGGPNWTKITTPVRIGKGTLDRVRSDNDAKAAMERSFAPRINEHLQKHDVQLLTDTMSQADQSSDQWTKFQGVAHVTTADNYLYGIDRTSNTFLNPTVINASTDANVSVATELELFDYINIDNGLSFRCEYGQGANLQITTGSLFRALKAQAEGRYQLYAAEESIPEFGFGGFKYPIIKYGQNYITYHPNVPSGTAYFLNMKYWVYEVHEKYNFIVEDVIDNAQATEGGGDYFRTKIVTMSRASCYRPDLQAVVTNLQAS